MAIVANFPLILETVWFFVYCFTDISL